MKTALITHAESQGHAGLPGYQENPDRLDVILDALSDPKFDGLVRLGAPLGDRDDILRVHPPEFISFIVDRVPDPGEFIAIDYDTALSPGTAKAALRGVGAACQGLDGVMSGDYDAAFCATRPPGHHAEPERAMGFCFFSNIAIAARRAKQVHGLSRIAVVDFDVHHGNGTQAALADVEGVYFASIHQHPHYPNTGVEVSEQGAGFVRNIPLPGGISVDQWRAEFENVILAEVDEFKPELILVSAGFDAHQDDPLGEFNLRDEDYRRLGEQLTALAKKHAQGRIVAVLEGGYNLDALARSTCAFIEALQAA